LQSNELRSKASELYRNKNGGMKRKQRLKKLNGTFEKIKKNWTQFLYD
jgi:hypothetical protein